MIIFEGDFVQLHTNFGGCDEAWLEVVTIEPYDLCVLSNGVRVCASDQYISNVKSAVDSVPYRHRG